MGIINKLEQKMSTKINLTLDIAIFVAFLVAFEPSLTGLPIHEWLSLAFTAAIITHLLFHWKWIVTLTAQFLRNLFHSSRLNFVVDMLFFIAITLIMFTGVMISRSIMPFFGFEMAENGPWRFLHSMAADLAVLTLGIHFALHWNWIVSAIKRLVIAPVGGLFRRTTASPNLEAAPVKVENK
jgi:hypothetical protein